MARQSLEDNPRWRESETQRFNLALLGGTGVGKSTLVNAIFGRKVTETGIGEPITKGVIFRVNDEDTLGFYDFEGAESFAALAGFVKNFRTIYKERLEEDPSNAIHVVWYCVKSEDRRIDDQQVELFKQLGAMGLPVILVLTQTRYKPGVGYPPDVQEFLQHIENRKLPIFEGRAIPVAALEDAFSGAVVHGLDELLDITRRAAPEGVRSGLEAAQRIDAVGKRAAALAWVATAAAVAAGIGATPVPVADALLLAPLQVSLLGRISKIFNIPPPVAALVSGSGSALTTLLGRFAAGGLAKLIPGWGQLIGASVAAALTGATGAAWLTLCERHFRGQIDLADYAQDEFVRVFIELVTQNLKGNRTWDTSSAPPSPKA